MKPRSQSSLILSIGIILAAVIIADTLYKIKSFDNTLQVVGSAKKTVEADQVQWRLELSRPVTTFTIKSGNYLLQKDLESVEKFLQENGISQNAYTINPVKLQNVYEQNGVSSTRFLLTQSIQLSTSQVALIAELSKRYQVLINQGVMVYANQPEYYVSKLPEIRVELLKDAMKDAKLRAKSIAESDDQNVGKLKSASAGVVQVLSKDSTNVSDYGTYDTSQIQKDVMVSVRAVFNLR